MWRWAQLLQHEPRFTRAAVGGERTWRDSHRAFTYRRNVHSQRVQEQITTTAPSICAGYRSTTTSGSLGQNKQPSSSAAGIFFHFYLNFMCGHYVFSFSICRLNSRSLFNTGEVYLFFLWCKKRREYKMNMPLRLPLRLLLPPPRLCSS